jgi:uncharacterized protein
MRPASRAGITSFLSWARRCQMQNYGLASTILSEISVATLGKGTDMSGTGAIEAQNIAVIRRGYEAFAKGDIGTLKMLFSADATWHATALGVLPGNYRGAQAILEFFGKLAQETKGTMRAEPQIVAASGDHVFVLERLTGKRKGKTQDTKTVAVFKLDKGVVTEVTDFPFDHPAAAQFWA